MHLAVQVLRHDWVVTRGGAAPRLLADGVARGAANVAALRRLRNLAHGLKLHLVPMLPSLCSEMLQHCCATFNRRRMAAWERGAVSLVVRQPSNTASVGFAAAHIAAHANCPPASCGWLKWSC